MEHAGNLICNSGMAQVDDDLTLHDARKTPLTSQPFLHRENLLELVGRPCEPVPEQAGTYLSDISVLTGWDSTRPMKGEISKTTGKHEIY